jgi:uncharacterized membrane protein YjdF
VNCRRKVFIAALLVWYVIFSISMAITPADRQFWLAANILPVIFVAALVVTHRLFPLSNGSYLLITIFLTLHTIGVYYTKDMTMAISGVLIAMGLIYRIPRVAPQS